MQPSKSRSYAQDEHSSDEDDFMFFAGRRHCRSTARHDLSNAFTQDFPRLQEAADRAKGAPPNGPAQDPRAPQSGRSSQAQDDDLFELSPCPQPPTERASGGTTPSQLFGRASQKYRFSTSGDIKSIKTGRSPVVQKWEFYTYDDQWAKSGLPYSTETLPPGVQYICGQPERNTTVDEDGHPKQHFQGFVAFSQALPRVELRSRLGFSPERGWGCVPVGNDMVKARIAYTKKQESAVRGERGESLWREAGVLSDNLKRRGDIHSEIVEILRNGGTERDVLERFPQMGLQYLSNIQKVRGIFERPKDRNDLQVYYIFGDTRVGKSYFVRNILLDGDNSPVFNKPHPASSTATDFWPPGYDGATRVLFDDWHPKKYNITDMLNYLQEYAMTVQVKGGYTSACWNRVYITTNVPIDKWYDHLPESYAGNIKALKARIPECNRMHMKRRPPPDMQKCTFAEMKAYQDSIAEVDPPAAEPRRNRLSDMSKEELLMVVNMLYEQQNFRD